MPNTVNAPTQTPPPTAPQAFAKGSDRGDMFKFMLAMMMSKVMGSNKLQTKAEKKEQVENFLKQAIETAMKQISNFGELESWLSQLTKNDKGYSPEFQAWIKEEASQMGDFKDEKASKALASAQANLKSNASALKQDSASLKKWESDVTGCEKDITDAKSFWEEKVHSLENSFNKEISTLESKEVKTHWYEPWTYVEDAALGVAMGISRAAEGVALAAVRTAEGFELGGLYTSLESDKISVSMTKGYVKTDKKRMKPEQAAVTNAENQINSAKNNLMDRVENGGQKQGDAATSGLQTAKTAASQIQAIEQDFVSLFGTIGKNGPEPSAHKSS